jgi:mannan endo-1,4-beta-mannosidase
VVIACVHFGIPGQISVMKLFSLLPLLAVVTALPTANDLAPRASISQVDGLKFNIDGVIKCTSRTSTYLRE